VRGVLLAVGIAVALGATAGVAFLALRERDGSGRDEPAPVVAADRTEDPPIEASPSLRIRPYETFQSLTEDLRDALALDDGSIQAECWRVSARVQQQAKDVLAWVARGESSPRVRALMVLAAGVHVPESGVLLARLSDHDARVRRAAALAVLHDPGGTRIETLLGVEVPLGRLPGEAARRDFRVQAGKESDPSVKALLESAGD